ncbi:Uncharacterised protein r2_g748 [Pycnogonum litorale]
MPFAIPRIWREPTNHHDDCYFRIVDISKYKKGKDRTAVVYPSISSSIAPVLHCEDLQIPSPSLNVSSDADPSSLDSDDVTLNVAGPSKSPHFPKQHELDDYQGFKPYQGKIRGFNISSQGVEFTRS